LHGRDGRGTRRRATTAWRQGPPRRKPMPDPTPDDLARQARQHLESLKAEGVEWLPKAPPPGPRRRKPAADADAAAPSLFEQAQADAAPALTPEQRRHELTVWAERVRPCTRCPELASTRTQTVYGIGPVAA